MQNWSAVANQDDFIVGTGYASELILAWFLSKNHVAVLIFESGVHLPVCTQEWKKEVIIGRCIGFSIAYYFQIVSARSKSFGGEDSKTYLVA